MIPPEHGEVLAISAGVADSADVYRLWDLRNQVAFEPRLGDPMDMQVYEILALIRENPENEEEVSNKFFFEDEFEPTVYASALPAPWIMASFPVNEEEWEENETAAVRSREPEYTPDPRLPEVIEPGIWLLTFYALAEEDKAQEVNKAFHQWKGSMGERVLTCSEELTVETMSDDPNIFGPLALRDMIAQAAGHKSSYPLAKNMYRGRVVMEVTTSTPRRALCLGGVRDEEEYEEYPSEVYAERLR